MNRDTHRSLAETAVLFKTTPSKIKARCAKGDFDYTVEGSGRYLITIESIIKHLPELELKNNDPTTAGNMQGQPAARGARARRQSRPNEGRWLR